MTVLADPLSLRGRTAIVTGGGTGIGAETARIFVRHGVDGVVLAARTQADLDRVKAELEELGAQVGNPDVRVLAVPTDVKKEESVVALVEAAIDAFGRIDVLVNNAGGTRMGPLESTPTKAWDSVFDLNAKGPFLCTREAGRHMIAAGRGVIVNLSSGAGVTGVRYGAGYSAAKAALQMFTRVTAAEWGRHGIRANCIAVGGVASERASAAWEVAGLDPAEMGKGTALGRIGVPADIGHAVLFLATDASAYVSGQTFSVDGGPVLGGPPQD
ncbi:SDR family NAD(P)-dependent oxidoreductase [Trujillonella endophytica]|uniref:NAD(P)-dependent dehydrogenase, short-chain alcohol dehydrogenase family n=1 Tax=Trujillonella endophytica TaxID=673521 RepID=A0A1H8T3N6_9ACTN|nr:SDR family oxidoreductase [Trujillella endophytica]SEO85551.1 NAD(P)-dependent dehydrogenase, short-chain alcohol dehydrogenase family [Trujillella endophytica]